MKNGYAPQVETKINTVLFFGYSTIKFFIAFAMAGIDAIITHHFEMFFRYVLNKTLNEFKSGNGFYNKFFVFVAVVMKGDIFTIIFVDSFRSYNRSAKVTTNVIGDLFRVALVWLSINIKTIFMVAINHCLRGFERFTYFPFHFIKKSGTERIAKTTVVEMCNFSPKKEKTHLVW